MSDGARTSAWADQKLVRACRVLGLDPRGARLLKFTNNAVFALDSYKIVVRVAGSEPVSAKARRGVAMARWLAQHDIPAVRLVEDFEQPIDLGGLAVTTWHQVPDEGTPVRPEDLGLLLRRLHEVTEATVDLPRWDQLASIRARLSAATTLTTDEHDFLDEAVDDVEVELKNVEPFLPPGPLHGDAHTGNVIPGPDGPLLCDFDSAATGPREWDLTPIAVGHLRLTPPPEAYPRFVKAYGVDLTEWTGFPVMRRLRELQLVTSPLPVLAVNPRLWSQWRLRFDTLRAGDMTTRWKRNE